MTRALRWLPALLLLASATSSAQSVRLAGDRLVLDAPLRFEIERARLRVESIVKVRELAVFLQANRALRLCIEGHLGADPGERGLMLFSRARANSVRELLVHEGVDGSRLEAHGYEASRPLVRLVGRPGSAQWRRAAAINNRIELRIGPASGSPCGT